MDSQPAKAAKHPRRKATWVLLAGELLGLGAGGGGGGWAILEARAKNQEIAALRDEVATLKAQVEPLTKEAAERKQHEQISAEVAKEIERMWRGKKQ